MFADSTKNHKKLLYWTAQIGGWFSLAFIIIMWVWFNQKFTAEALVIFGAQTLLGIVLSHTYRIVFIRLGWLNKDFTRMVLLFIVGSVFFGIIMSAFYAVMLDFGFPNVDLIIVRPYEELIGITFNWIFIYFLWSAIYLIYFYLGNYEKEEVRNLRLEAAKNHMELVNLRSQLNPHFMFNAMNSIRALIDENPAQAKHSLTEFSNMLRSTLLSGKKDFITLEEELAVVKNYLNLQSIRYEEKLKVVYDIGRFDMNIKIPPFVIQTLVENAVKHGVGNRVGGGKIEIKIQYEKDQLICEVYNSGIYDPKKHTETGIGLKNTRKRLALLYNGTASLNVFNENSFVVSKLIIPKSPSI